MYVVFKGIVHPKIQILWKYSHPLAIQDMDVYCCHRADLEICTITWLSHQWILCSEWVPSEWVLAGDKKHHNQQLMSCETKTSIHLSIILLSSAKKKKVLSESGETKAQIKQSLHWKTVQNSSEQICQWILRDNRRWLFHWRKCYYSTHSLQRIH